MDHTKKVSTWRIAGKWILIVAIIVGVSAAVFIQHLVSPSPEERDSPADNPIVHAIVFGVLGVLALGFGIAGYFIVICTNCFTFNFNHPVWNGMKMRKYFLNIVVSLGLSLGPGFILAGILGPIFARLLGLSQGQAGLIPLLAFIVGFQLLQLWILIWTPVYRRMIQKRLAAMGITREQLQSAILVGLSNPASGRNKRFAAIEEDMGALWVTPDRLAFRGDVEQFDLTREQIAEIERKEDKGSTSMLAGIAHVILHVRLDDGSIRQIRLHTEGQWTMGQKRQAMDGLAYAIHNWYEGKVAAV
ncbi:MAG TPA: hypothetical protein VMH87_05850 [Pseudomonadales bacterium]|nr:hypothetical protein [Pseudomonadales bacterium]